VDGLKTQLEKAYADRREKDTKLQEKVIADKDEEIADLNALVAKLQAKIREQRSEKSTASMEL
jgi:hypothetical protein